MVRQRKKRSCGKYDALIKTQLCLIKNGKNIAGKSKIEGSKLFIFAAVLIPSSRLWFYCHKRNPEKGPAYLVERFATVIAMDKNTQWNTRRLIASIPHSFNGHIHLIAHYEPTAMTYQNDQTFGVPFPQSNAKLLRGHLLLEGSSADT